MQGVLGAVRYGDLKVENSEGNGYPVDVDLSMIAQFGGVWSTRPFGKYVQYGLECGFLSGYTFDEVSSVQAGGGGGGGLEISVSTELWMLDLFGGGYVNVQLGKIGRFYAGGGPLLLFASYEAEREESGGSRSSYVRKRSMSGFGAYARAGIEVCVHEEGFVGLSARASWSHADFSDVGGCSEMDGYGWYITYTAGF